MVLKKNWFTILTLVIFEICAVYALLSGVNSMSAPKTYPFLWYGGALCVFAGVLALVHGIAKSLARIHVASLLPEGDMRSKRIENLIVGAVILAAAAARIWAIVRFPITPFSDYQTYDQVAGLLAHGTLGSNGYSGYIAEFPHVIGYSFILSLLYRITGPSVQAGLYLNMVASLFSVFLTYKIARQLGGRLCGFIALLAAAFWPSQILYGALLGSEAVFTCMMLLSIWLFLYLWKYPITIGNIEGSMFLCIFLGVLLALTAAVRPLSEIMLVASILCLIPLAVRFNKNEKMLNSLVTRAACQGWFRALVILLSYAICSQLLSLSISNTIEYKLPGASVSYGYNLMVGVNVDGNGAWNQEDANFLDNEFHKTNSAVDAQKASLGVALQRIHDNPLGVLNLALEKFTFLWENDDYGSTWVTLGLNQQGNLTPDRQSTINNMTQLNGDIYLICILLSAVLGFQLLQRKDANRAHVLILLFIGTVILHMILECQNRYHYHILPVFMILAAMAVSEIFRSYARTPERMNRSASQASHRRYLNAQEVSQ